MRLPKFIGNKITAYVDEENYLHQMACHDVGVDMHDIDPINELPWALDNCFPEHLKADGLRTYRTIAWGELWATFWIPTHRKLRLCKIGWHHWGMVYRFEPRYTQCGSCDKRSYTYVPRWAR
jgi:hypothetical protein